MSTNRTWKSIRGSKKSERSREKKRYNGIRITGSLSGVTIVVIQTTDGTRKTKIKGGTCNR